MNWHNVKLIFQREVRDQLRDRRTQRALLQFFKPENWFEVRRALIDAGRADLIGPARAEALVFFPWRRR